MFGWTWQKPLPQGNTLRGVSAADANNAWAVGDFGTILYARGTGPFIAVCSPTSAAQGTSLSVDITGNGTHFVNGTSAATFTGDGITVNSTTVIDATHARANITISGAATPGARDVNVITGTETPACLARGLTVNAPNPCGGGAGGSIGVFGIMMGLLSIAGTAGLRRRIGRG